MSNNNNKLGLSWVGWLKLLGTVLAAIVAAFTAQSCGLINL